MTKLEVKHKAENVTGSAKKDGQDSNAMKTSMNVKMKKLVTPTLTARIVRAASNALARTVTLAVEKNAPKFQSPWMEPSEIGPTGQTAQTTNAQDNDLATLLRQNMEEVLVLELTARKKPANLNHLLLLRKLETVPQMLAGPLTRKLKNAPCL